jgi:protein required for attachment to host cells
MARFQGRIRPISDHIREQIVTNAFLSSGHGETMHADQKRRAEEEFIATVLSWIAKSENLATFDRLIIAAPARTLGETRAALPASLAGRIYHEIHGDLLKLPIKELEKRVQASMLDLGTEGRQAS